MLENVIPLIKEGYNLVIGRRGTTRRWAMCWHAGGEERYAIPPLSRLMSASRRRRGALGSSACFCTLRNLLAKHGARRCKGVLAPAGDDRNVIKAVWQPDQRGALHTAEQQRRAASEGMVGSSSRRSARRDGCRRVALPALCEGAACSP